MEVLSIEAFKKKIFNYDVEKEWKYSGTLPAIVDFYADWCGPCKMLAPVLEEIAKDYAGKLEIYKVDTEATPELAGLFQVRGIPALLFIPPEGKPTMAAGFMPKEGLQDAIRKVLSIEPPSNA